MSKLLISFNIFLIKSYQFIISPIFANKCRYFPTCSQYYIDALKTHGFVKGTYLGFKRILSCHPIKILGGGSGLDFVPNKKSLTKEK
tara:strand:- start:1198 stop:1458 length:261 start_codon:yes stop_codon:yes gene_type:complete